jgi:hypothetical protein
MKEQGKQASADQHARFLETARAFGCDEDEAAFDEKLKAVANAKSAPRPPKVSKTTFQKTRLP